MTAFIWWMIIFDLTLKYIRQYYDSSAQGSVYKDIGNVDVYQIRSK